MNMTATVLRVNPQSLLVRDESNGQEVLVLFRGANTFSSGDRIRITFNGQMTPSIPPQITATAIQRLSPAGSQPSGQTEMEAVVLRRGRGYLIVRRVRDRQQIRVEYRDARYFCPNQRVRVSYDTFTFGNPPRVTATDVSPIC